MEIKLEPNLQNCIKIRRIVCVKGLEQHLALPVNIVMVNSPLSVVKQAAVYDLGLEGSRSLITMGYQGGP